MNTNKKKLKKLHSSNSFTWDHELHQQMKEQDPKSEGMGMRANCPIVKVKRPQSKQEEPKNPIPTKSR